MTFHCWVFRRWVIPPYGIPDVGYSVQLPIKWHSIVGNSGQTWTEYPQNIICYIIR